jgi:hypothetical protein
MNDNGKSRRPQINPPREEQGSVEYLSECVFAVGPSVVSLIEAAAKAGWNRKQLLVAIMVAADGYIQSSGDQLHQDDLQQFRLPESDLLN